VRDGRGGGQTGLGYRQKRGRSIEKGVPGGGRLTPCALFVLGAGTGGGRSCRLPSKDKKTLTPSPRDQPWPAEDLESPGHCPACGAAARTLLFEGLWDNAFNVAPGRWTMWRCGRCGSGYLDPRPTPDSIGRAYGTYYTHEEPRAAPPSATLRSRVRVALANGYRNARYGTKRSPAWAVGRFVGRLWPRIGRPVDLELRFLDRGSAEGVRPKLLDIGFGSGAFLRLAQEAGWDVSGVDSDPIAVEAARKRGLAVELGDVGMLGDRRETYDAVTLHHVIEHLHDPGAALDIIRSILKPGGRFHVGTPNLDSIGRELYGRNWRGLEAPRHLVIFNRESLVALLRRSGFSAIRYEAEESAFGGVSVLSARIAAGLDPNLDAPHIAGASRWQRLRARLAPGRADFMNFVCEKPLP
jgi:SAM-dependent methyltransferase